MSVLLEPAPCVAPAARDLIDHMLPAVPGTIARLEQGANLLFAGCGRAESLVVIAGLFPRSRFFGVENEPEALGAARSAVRENWLQNTQVSPDPIRQPHLQDIFDFVIRQRGETGAPMHSLPSLLREGGLLFDLGAELPSPADYHDAGFVILRSLRLPDGCRCVVAGNWITPTHRT
jgi:hypothetical protein